MKDLYLLLPLAAYFIHAFLVYLALRVAPRRFLNRIFSLFLLSMALWGLTIYAMRSSPTLPQAFFWEKWVLTWLAAAPVFYFHFTLAFLGVQPRPRTLWAFYGLLVFFVAASHGGLLATGMQLRPYGYAPVLGPLFAPYVLFIYGTILLSTSYLWRGYRALAGAERNRIAYLIAGPIISILGGTSDYVAAMGLPIYPLGIVSNIAFGLLSTIAILKHQLLDIQLVARRGTAYVLTAAAAILVFVAVTAVFLSASGRSLTPAEQAELAVQAAVMLVLAAVFQPAVRWVHGQTDRIFFRERWVPIRELEAFARETQDVTDLPSVAQRLVDLVARATHATRVALVVPGSRAALVYTSGEREAQALPLPWDSPILAWLARQEVTEVRALEVLPQWQALSAQEREALERLEGKLFLPLRRKDALIALLVLGAKAHRRPYTQEEEDLLKAVSYHAAAVLENAGLYDQLRQRLAELQRTQDQLIRSAKLAAVGELAAAVAHEVNNPLQTILNLTYLISSDPAAAPLQEDLKLVEEEVLRARSIVQGLLEFARRGEVRRGMEDLNAIIQAVVNLAQVRVRDGRVQVECRLHPELPRVWADGEQLRQVFMNLISNAFDAMPQGGTLTIATRAEDGHVVVEFSDTGCGIPQEIQARIFEPFFTTKGPGQGTGLGLAVSHSIVERHGGTISVRSAVGRGTTFTVVLPVTHAEEKVVTSHG